MAEHLVEAQTIVVRFHGQTPIIYHFMTFYYFLSPWQVPRMVRDPAVNRAVSKRPCGFESHSASFFRLS